MSLPLRVLLVEDSPTDAKLITRALESSLGSVHVLRVQDADAMRAALEGSPWDIVLSDWSMPDFDARAALSLLRGMGHDLPFIIVSGTIGEETAVAALRAGATDFVLKDRLARLGPAVEREIREYRARADRVRTEAALRDSEALNRRLVDTNIVGVVYWAGDTLLEANEVFLSTLGYSEADIAARALSWSRLTPPEHAAADDAARAQLVATGRCLPYEKELYHRDGARIPILAASATDPGCSDRGIAFILDLRERNRALAEVRASEARFRRLFETRNEGFWIVDTEQRSVMVNRSLAEMLGHAPSEMIGRPLEDFVDQGDLDRLALVLGQGHPRVSRETTEIWLRRADGSPILARVDGTPLFDERGAHEGAFAAVLDITEQRRAEEALRASEEQLRQAQKLEAIGVLAGGVAHDFNNLMSVILSYSTWLTEDLKPGDPMLDDVVEIRRAAERASDLTRQLLAFSRRQVLLPQVLDLNDIVDRMEKMLRRLIGEDVELIVHADPRLPKVMVDPGQIEQVLMNLCINARDAMPTGGKLTIETAEVLLDGSFAAQHAGASAGPHVVLVVTDTGCGMDAATQARIFEPFFTTKEKGRGTGLGLSTVLGIVQQSGGSIWVYSEPGWGSCFKIYLPVVQGQVAATTPARRTDVKGSETVLVVEDDAAVRVLTRAILRRHGYHVLDAPGGGEALLIGEEHPGPIHLLLTDVVMPHMSGRELAERLRPLRPDMRVLYISGYTDDAVVLHGVVEHDVAFLQKPITPESLLRKVRDVLDAAPAAAMEGGVLHDRAL